MFDDVIDAKDKLFNAIIVMVDDTIKKSALEAKNQSLDPIQTFNCIQDNVDELLDNIEKVLDITITESIELEKKIDELIKPYDDAKEIEIEKRVDEILNSETLYDLFERTQKLFKVCNEINNFSSRSYIIKRKTKTLK